MSAGTGAFNFSFGKQLVNLLHSLAFVVIEFSKCD